MGCRQAAFADAVQAIRVYGLLCFLVLPFHEAKELTFVHRRSGRNTADWILIRQWQRSRGLGLSGLIVTSVLQMRETRFIARGEDARPSIQWLDDHAH